MKKSTRLWVKKISASLMATLILLISIFPVITFAEGNFKPGNFKPGTFTPGTFTPGTFTPGTFTPGTFTPGTFTPGTFTPGTFTPGTFTPGTFTPGTFSPGEFTPGEFTPSDFMPSDVPPNTTGNEENISFPDPSNNPSLHDNVDTVDNISGKPERPKRFHFEDNQDYIIFKLVTEDMLFPAIEGLDRFTIMDIDLERYQEDWIKGIGKGVLRNRLSDMFNNDSFVSDVGNLGLDAWSGVDHYSHVKKFLKPWSSVKSAWQYTFNSIGFGSVANKTGDFLSNMVKPFDMGTGIAGKAAPWMAAVSTVISGAETFMHFANGSNVDGFASLGETLMSGAVVLSATGVGAPIAAGVAVVGGLLWTVSMGIKHRETVVRAAKAVGEGVVKVTKAIGNTVKEGVNLVKSGFKKVAGWFG